MARGRPTKLTDALRDELVKLIQAGNYIETAAAAVGIHKDSLYEWLKRGAREKKGPYREFSDAVQKAMGFAESRDVLLIAKAAASQWQAAAWRLERKYPARWGRKDRMEVTGKGGAPIQHRHDLTGLSDDKLETLEAILEEATARPKQRSDAGDGSGGVGEEEPDEVVPVR